MPLEEDGTTRIKYIHTVGSCAKVNFESADNHPFTGMFKGATNCIIRVGATREPNPDVK